MQKQKSTKSHQKYPTQIFDKTKQSKMRYRMLLSFFFTTTSDSVAKSIFGHHFDTENEMLVNFKKRSKSSTHLM
ncbi:hypothetical protein B9Z55_013163 [Caenorhabditis nigoni]|uniref:Uncharacterized protein n=1 Tax=Caenorhabditis nigoni TaxID=1611254 RepID=A0A2G5U0R7_9PELO|nr:hypothetical protein B9Z55_013163 [Caenorhabditis nigoni]